MSAEPGPEASGSASGSASGKVGEGFHLVSSLSELKKSGRKRLAVGDRMVVVFHVAGQLYALDYFCYHAGGPLEQGDIEDSYGRLCVVCPWHKHTITLDTGESLYTAIDPANPRRRRYNCSKGVKQRVHHVKTEGDQVYVKLSDMSTPVDSDRYFQEEFRELRENTLKEPVLRHAPLRVPLHSSRTGLK